MGVETGNEMGLRGQGHVLPLFTKLHAKCRDVARALCLGGVRQNLPEFTWLTMYSNGGSQKSFQNGGSQRARKRFFQICCCKYSKCFASK